MYRRQLNTAPLVIIILAASLLTGFGVIIGNAQSAGQAPKKSPSTPALIAQGKQVYASLDCNTCHVIAGVGTAAGPELTHIGKSWTRTKITAMVRTPGTVIPKGWMPAYASTKISDPNLSALSAYLRSLK